MRDSATSLLSRLLNSGAAVLARRLGAAAPEDRLAAALERADLVVASAQAELGRLVAAEHEMRKTIDAASQEAAEAGAAAEALIWNGRDEDARRAVAKAIDQETALPHWKAALTRLGEERAALDLAVLRLLERRRTMADDVNAVRAAGAGRGEAQTLAAVEGELIAALAAAARVPEAAAAARETAAAAATLRKEERARRIEARIAAARSATGADQ